MEKTIIPHIKLALKKLFPNEYGGCRFCGMCKTCKYEFTIDPKYMPNFKVTRRNATCKKCYDKLIEFDLEDIYEYYRLIGSGKMDVPQKIKEMRLVIGSW